MAKQKQQLIQQRKTIPLTFFMKSKDRGVMTLLYEAQKLELPGIDENLALALAMSATAHHIHYKIEGVGANVIKRAINIGVIGEAGGGKSTATNKIFDKLISLLNEKEEKFIKTSTFTTPEAIAELLSNGKSVVQVADEVHQIFKMRKLGAHYTGWLIELWKMSFTRTSLPLHRRRAKSIYVPEGATYTVIWTTTFDDFETITDMIDKPLLRRFILIKNKGDIDILDIPSDASELWRKAAEMIKFLNEFDVIIRPRTTTYTRQLRQYILTVLAGRTTEFNKILKTFLTEYAIKFAAVLALDRFTALIDKLASQIDQSVAFFSCEAEKYKAVLQQYINSNHQPPSPEEGVDHNFSSTAMATDHNFTHVSPEKKTETHSYREPPSLLKDMLKKLLKKLKISVEDTVDDVYNALLRCLFDIVDGIDKGESVDVLTLLSNELLPSPAAELDGDKLILYVPEIYALLGMLLAYIVLVNAADLYEVAGTHPKWTYFVRRLRELGEKFDIVDMRILSQYMRKFGGYTELWDYTQRAVACGLLQLTEDSTPERPKFYIVKEVPRIAVYTPEEIRKILENVVEEVGKEAQVTEVVNALARKLETKDMAAVMQFVREAEKHGFIEQYINEVNNKPYYRIKVK